MKEKYEPIDFIASVPLAAGGRGISTLIAMWAASRRGWTGKCCLMISLLFKTLLIFGDKKARDLPDLVLCVALAEIHSAADLLKAS